MNRLPLLLLFCLPFLLPAQDLLVEENGDERIVRIVEVSDKHVHFVPWDDQEAEPLSLRKKQLYMVTYEDGMQQYFQVEHALKYNAEGAVWLPEDSVSLYGLGRADARMYYDKSAPFWGSFGATVWYPFLGVVTGGLTAAVIAAVPPNPNVEDLPYPDLYYEEAEYAAGFDKEVQKDRGKKALKGFGVGVGAQSLLFLLVLIALL
jgi:hypothetical protein